MKDTMKDTRTDPLTWGWHIGTSYLMHLPPGWEVAGELVDIHRDAEGNPATLEFDHGVYIESVTKSVHRLAAAKTPKAMREEVSASHPIPHGMLVAAHVVTHAVPMKCAARILHGAEAADAVKEA